MVAWGARRGGATGGDVGVDGCCCSGVFAEGCRQWPSRSATWRSPAAKPGMRRVVEPSALPGQQIISGQIPQGDSAGEMLGDQFRAEEGLDQRRFRGVYTELPVERVVTS